MIASIIGIIAWASAIVTGSSLCASEALASTPISFDAKHVESALKSRFDAIAGIEFEIKTKAVATEIFFPDKSSTEREVCSMFRCKWLGGSFRYDIRTVQPDGTKTLICTHAYDGVRDQYFMNDSEEILELRTKKTSLFLNRSNALLEMYAYLLEEKLDDDSGQLFIPTFDDLKRSEVWESFLARANFEAPEAKSGTRGDAVRFTVDAGTRLKDGIKFHYVVTVDPAHGAATREIIKYSEKGTVVFSARVEKLGRITLLGEIDWYYPAETVAQTFDESGRLLFTTRNEISVITADPGKIDPQEFTIDPASAKGIYDEEAGTLIEIPK